MKTLGIALLTWLLSIVAGVAAMVLAEFGAPIWVFLLLLGWLLTLGLPSLTGILLVTRLWGGPSFGAFLVWAAAVALVFQYASVWMLRTLWQWRKARPA